MSHPHPDAVIARLIEARETKGQSVAAVARELGMKPKAAYDALRSRGLARTYTPWTYPKIRRVLSRIEQGWTYQEIADELGTSRAVISQVRTKHGPEVITVTRLCVFCDKPFTYEQKSGIENACSDDCKTKQRAAVRRDYDQRRKARRTT